MALRVLQVAIAIRILARMDGESKTKRGAQLFALRKLQFNSTTIKSKSIAGSVLKAVLRAIDDHGAICWASAATIASETCLGERSVFYALEALRTLGYISIDSRPGRTSSMVINWENIPNPKDTPAQYAGVGSDLTPAQDADTHALRADTPAQYADTPAQSADEALLNRKPKRKLNEKPSVSLFDEFWESYPKKEGKKKAKEAFEKAVKNGADPKAIIEGAKAYAASDRGTGDPQFIKQPSTFLNGQHWEDEPAAWSKGRAVPFEDPCHKPFPKLKVTRADLAIDDFVLDWNRALTRMDYLSDETRTIAREVFKDEWWLENRKAIVVSFEDRERLIRIGKLKDSPYPHHIELDWIFDNAALVKSLIGSPVPNEMDLAKFGGNE